MIGCYEGLLLLTWRIKPPLRRYCTLRRPSIGCLASNFDVGAYSFERRCGPALLEEARRKASMQPGHGFPDSAKWRDRSEGDQCLGSEFIKSWAGSEHCPLLRTDLCSA